MKVVYFNAITPVWAQQLRRHAKRNIYDNLQDVLLSYYHWKNSWPYLPTGERAVFGDSGGFSILTSNGQASIDPVNVMRWQLKTCTLGVLLDIPVRAASFFDECLATTLSNTERALPVYRVENERNFKWWGVVHGYDAKQMDEWYGRVCELHTFDAEGEGWAFKPRPTNDPAAVAAIVRFAVQHNLKRIHVLGISSVEMVTVLVAGAKLMDAKLEFASVDSSSPIQSGRNRLLYHQTDGTLPLAQTKEMYRQGERTNMELMQRCPCDSCKWYREDADKVAGKEDLYMMMHNSQVLCEKVSQVEQRAKSDPEAALRTLKDYPRIISELEGQMRRPTKSTTVSLYDRIRNASK